MSVRATKFGATEAEEHLRSIVDGEGFRFVTLSGYPPLNLVGEEENPRLFMIQRSKSAPAPRAALHVASFGL